MIELFAACKNEIEFLPYFFKHYNGFVDRYVIFDQNSTDGSRELMRKNMIPVIIINNYEVKKRELGMNDFRNNYYKEGNKDDWVIVVDIDEILYHNNILGYLADCEKENKTVLKSIGFEMVCEDYQKPKGNIYDGYKEGTPSALYCKCSIFKRRVNIQYNAGMHTCAPSEPIKESEIKLLHYKYLGMQKLNERIAKRQSVISQENINYGFGVMNPDIEYQIFNNLLKNKKKVV